MSDVADPMGDAPTLTGAPADATMVDATSTGDALRDNGQAIGQASGQAVAVTPSDPERDTLLERLLAAVRGIEDIRHLREVVEQAELLQRDYAERATLDDDVVETADLLARARQPALIRQLAFYFSDANLRHDWYLREKIAEDPAEQGYIPIAMLLPFNRLREIGCKSAIEVAASVEAAPPSAGLELSSGRDRLRRAGNAPLPAIAGPRGEGSVQDQCTVRIEGFPRGDGSVTAEAVTDLCRGYGEVGYVRLMRDGAAPTPPAVLSEFLGVAEVEFGTKEAAAAAVAAQPAPVWCGAPLKLKSLAEFRAGRSELRGTRKRPHSDTAGEGCGEDSIGKRARIEEEAASSLARFERGCVLRLKDIPQGVRWMDIKDAFCEYGDVVYVDLQTEGDGPSAGYVRMRSAEGVVAALDGLGKTAGLLTVPVRDKPHKRGVLAIEDTGPAAHAGLAATATASTREEQAGAAAPASAAPAPVAEAAAAAPAEGDGAAVEAEDEALEPKTAVDPYGDATPALEPQTVADQTVVDPYGGGEETDGAGVAAESTQEAAEAAPDSSPSAVAEAATGAAAEPFVVHVDGEQTAATGSAAEPFVVDVDGEQTASIAVDRLSGEDEEIYLQKMSLSLAERRAADAAKGINKGGKYGKDGKGQKGSKGGKGGKDGKGFKGGKDGKGFKGGKKGRKGGKYSRFDESDDSS